jgi:hypothetical protein
MKKILTITAIALTAKFAFAGDVEAEFRNFRFGLKVTPSINWYQPTGKIISPNGVGLKFGGGLITEFRLTKVVSFQTGLQIDLDGANVKYNNGGLNNPSANTINYFYNIADDAIVKYDHTLAGSNLYTHYQLNERKYNITYITLPLTLKMKTKEIGDFVYYGQIGINNSFRWKASATDQLTVINDNTHTLEATDRKSQIAVTKDVSFYTASLNFGLGAEMNISGTTAFTFGLNYKLGFTNVVKDGSDYIDRQVNDLNGISTQEKMPQQIHSSAVIITVGVLF